MKTSQPLSAPATIWHKVGNSPWLSFLTIAVCAVYLAPFVVQNWMPHDEGTLSHLAYRVFDGEVPHLDFEDAYTGGLTYFHALSFRFLGVKLSSIRWFLFLAAVPWLACVHWIAARRLPRWAAGLLTFTALAWSLPNYFAGLPSWYLLIFGTFGIAATLRFVDTGRLYWLLVAGIWGGLGILFKISALFYVGGVLMFLLFHEREAHEVHNRLASETEPKRGAYSIFVTALCLTFVVLVGLLLRRHLRPMEIVTYLIPLASLCLAMVILEWRGPGGRFVSRFGTICRLTATFVGGTLLPVALLLLVFWRAGALDELYRGVVVLPQQFVKGVTSEEAAGVPGLQRFVEAVSSHELPSPIWLLPALPLAAFMTFGGRLPRRLDRPLALTLAGILAVGCLGLWFFLRQPAVGKLGDLQATVYKIACFSARSLLPLVTPFIAWILMDRRNGEEDRPRRRQELLLLAMCTTVMSLIQYPYATAIYYFYFAPLVILTLGFVVASSSQPFRRTLTVCAAFYLAFGLAWLNTGFNRSHGVRYLPALPTVPLDLTRGDLHVPTEDRRIYETVIKTIEENTRAGEAILAGPDCPEIYFLSNRRNLTRTFFGFFANPLTEPEKILEFLKTEKINLVVINRNAEFSVPAGPKLFELLAPEYPRSLKVKQFVILWKSRPSMRSGDQ